MRTPWGLFDKTGRALFVFLCEDADELWSWYSECYRAPDKTPAQALALGYVIRPLAAGDL